MKKHTISCYEDLENRSVIVTSPHRDLNIDIDPAMFEKISNALRPNVLSMAPEGYYCVAQLTKMMKMSKSQMLRRIKKLKDEKKIKEVEVLVPCSTRSMAVPYYKFL